MNTSHNEKEGGRQRSDSSFLPFKQMLSDCGMLEFPFTGTCYHGSEREHKEQR